MLQPVWVVSTLHYMGAVTKLSLLVRLCQSAHPFTPLCMVTILVAPRLKLSLFKFRSSELLYTITVLSKFSSVLWSEQSCVHFYLGMRFTESLSVVIVGHWFREQKLMREHFNFCDDSAKRNVIEFDSGNIRNNPVSFNSKKNKNNLRVLHKMLSKSRPIDVVWVTHCICSLLNRTWFMTTKVYLWSKKKTNKI